MHYYGRSTHRKNEYIGDNIKEASNRNGVDVVRDTSDTGKMKMRMPLTVRQERIAKYTV